MKINLRNWGLLIGLLSTTFSWAEPVETLVHALKAWQAVQVDFQQLTADKVYKGRLRFKRPGIFYWERFSPSYYLVEIKEGRITSYDAELKQVIRQKLGKQFVPAQLLMDPQRVLVHFTLQKKVVNAQEIFTLIPKKMTEVAQIQVIFQKGKLKELNFIDQFQQKTRIIFGRFYTYQPLHWRIPTDADVIEE